MHRRYALPMHSTFLVMTGGAIGAAIRYHVGLGVTAAAGDRWPLATLAVNLAGALAMGLLAGWLMTRDSSEGWRLFIGVGLLGGFTTFSAFSLEMWRLVERGDIVPALLYAAASVIGTVVLVAAGIAVVRSVAA